MAYTRHITIPLVFWCNAALHHVQKYIEYPGRGGVYDTLNVHAPQWCVVWIDECNGDRSIRPCAACTQLGLLNYTTVTN
ncbi:uncharacterized protein BJ212DRAFT_1336003 [Suillus subaureus]|uniref:Uncharacterized protein n=1 Tax=Suillus subaureus TaxID=48587 RepID=A0A9P7EG19_9AGAM|nr:uncharacterized protein BJ212DRAFT_1336003 [Suillus subaureus]KAG1820866.1 hypothetical protein BJ212DRAFT_1336003 [Suillus subaureus]